MWREMINLIDLGGAGGFFLSVEESRQYTLLNDFQDIDLLSKHLLNVCFVQSILLGTFGE